MGFFYYEFSQMEKRGRSHFIWWGKMHSTLWSAYDAILPKINNQTNISDSHHFPQSKNSSEPPSFICFHRMSARFFPPLLSCIFLFSISLQLFIFFPCNISQEQICVKHLYKSWSFPSQSHLWFSLQLVSLKFIFTFQNWTYVQSMREEQSYVDVKYTICH